MTSHAHQALHKGKRLGLRQNLWQAKMVLPVIFKAQEKFVPWNQLQGQLHSLNLAVTMNDVAVIRSSLQLLVNGYQPSGKVVDWVHMAQERKSADL